LSKEIALFAKKTDIFSSQLPQAITAQARRPLGSHDCSSPGQSDRPILPHAKDLWPMPDHKQPFPGQYPGPDLPAASAHYLRPAKNHLKNYEKSLLVSSAIL
jgi:hypothetical protein